MPTNKTLTLQKRQGVLYSRQAEKGGKIVLPMMGKKERKDYHEKRRLSKEHEDGKCDF